MEEDLHVVPCSSLAVECIIRIGTAGAIWGLCVGPYDARQQGLTGLAQASFVAKSARNFGIRCGLVAGLYSITRCGIQSYRKQNDWVNGLIAGAVAGGAVAARSRSWKQVIGMAGLVSAFCAAADYS
ncbi:outer envelope pore protein 16-4, chloroplastic isoform X1 [Gastrolobium bilobum]|uniref:outer envelope pore protein 16-4, chloroplastic isoform X1 n=1 Tax=Gastrolobium bilobum TaxID=150636 RepID=UPI002AB24E44|nr:outer envelope pore protein 16-4, chloroplastic isoform X1 [Gastrolobium bilobum]